MLKMLRVDKDKTRKNINTIIIVLIYADIRQMQGDFLQYFKLSFGLDVTIIFTLTVF